MIKKGIIFGSVTSPTTAGGSVTISGENFGFASSGWVPTVQFTGYIDIVCANARITVDNTEIVCDCPEIDEVITMGLRVNIDIAGAYNSGYNNQFVTQGIHFFII